MTSLPEAVEEYVSDAQLTFSDQKHSPDRTFYKKKVLALVQGKTIWRAWKDGFLEQRELEGVPIFLCGGGSRMSYYGQLRTDLKSFPGCTWLKTTRECCTYQLSWKRPVSFKLSTTVCQ